MQDENREERYAREVLEFQGFTVERVSVEPGKRRADFRARRGVEEFVVEVTDKKETEFLRSTYEKARLGGMHVDSRQISPRNTVDGIIRDKAVQLEQTPASDGAFRVLWLSALNEDDHFLIEEARMTVYGLADLYVSPPDVASSVRPCFYYHHSTFHAVPGIDGMVLVSRDGGHLCINPFSPRAELFRRSELAAVFPEASMIDPLRCEMEGSALVLDGHVNRKDVAAKQEYLQRKYGLRTSEFKWHEIVGVARISPEDLDDECAD